MIFRYVPAQDNAVRVVLPSVGSSVTIAGTLHAPYVCRKTRSAGQIDCGLLSRWSGEIMEKDRRVQYGGITVQQIFVSETAGQEV